MKKFKYLVIGFLTLAMTACVDLVENPVNQLATEYFSDLTALRSGINGTYRQLIADNWERSVQVGSFRVPLMGADDMTTLTGANKEDWSQFDQFYQSSANTRLQRTTWSMLYDVIRQANWDIEGAKGLEGKYAQEDIDALVAESYFLRGWSYFWLVRVFGGVPILTSTTVTDDVYNVKRKSVEEVYDQVLADFAFAENHLPEEQPAYGQIDKWIALATLAEVHLTMAGWPLNQVEHYADARDYAKQIIDNGPFSLMEEYASIFQMANEGNSEIIWALSLCPVEDCGNGFTGSWMAKATKPAELNGWEDMFVELSFFERYPDGDRKDFNFLSKLKVPSTSPSDPFYINSLNDTTRYKYTDYTNFTTAHPYLKKYWDGFYDSALVSDDPLQPVTPLSAIDLPMTRLAKIHLIYAEAQARADGSPSAESYELLNQIRRRGKGYALNDVGSDADLNSGLSTDDFVRAVVDEKGWELVGELNRWFDLIRTERLEEVIALRSPNEPLAIQNPVSKQYYLAPIPATERVLNPLLEQNPGYTN